MLMLSFCYTRSIHWLLLKNIFVLLTSISLMTSTVVYAASLQIWPIEITLKSTGEIAAIQVNNVSDESALVQAMATAWHLEAEGANGKKNLTDDLLISPPVFELPGRSSQTIRLALRNPMEADSEKTYRLVVTELPRTAGLIPNSLAASVSIRLPVFVKPEGSAPNLRWSVANTEFGGLHLLMSNDGNAHINVKRVKMSKLNDQQSVFESENGGYVLAGDSMRWPLDVALSALKGPIVVNADSSIGPIRAAVTLPDY